MIKKSLSERYADVDLRRVVENPRDELERQYSEEEAKREAQAIWGRFGKGENHRKRVIMLLAHEALKDDLPPPDTNGLLQ